MELLFRWPYRYGELQERAAGALANLAGDDKCSREIARAGGVHALAVLVRNCNYEGAQAQAARGLANLAAYGDTDKNNAAIRKEHGALRTLIRMMNSPREGVKQEAVGALWNLAYDSKNTKLIARFGGVEALVALARSCLNGSRGLQEGTAGALWGLAHSEENSIVIGLEGGIPPLIALARSQAQDVHVTAAGALWNLSFNDGNALRIVEGGGVIALAHLSTSSPSKMARFLAALTLAYIFDGRLDEYVRASPAENVCLDNVRISALKYIESYIKTFMDQQSFATAASSSPTPSMLAQVLEKVRIQEADNLICSGEEIARFVTMLRNPSHVLNKIAAFALLQFTIPGASNAKDHASLMHEAGDVELLRSAAAATSMPREAKMFVEIVLRNLEHHQPKCSKRKAKII